MSSRTRPAPKKRRQRSAKNSRFSPLPVAATAVAALAAATAAAVILISREALALWQAGEYGSQHVNLLAPYVICYAASQAPLWRVLGAMLAAFALFRLPMAQHPKRRLLAASVVWLALVLAAAGYTGFRLRHPVDRLQSTLTLSDEQFLRLFDLSRPGLAGVAAEIAEGRIGNARQQLLAYYRAKFANSLPGQPEDKWKAVLENADAALAHRFTARGVTHTLGENIDWGFGFKENREWTRFLNRLSWWPELLQAARHTGEARYAEEFSRQLADWLHDNPLPRWKDELNPAWVLIGAGRRLRDTWIESFQLALATPGISEQAQWDLLRSAHDHAQYLMYLRTHFNHLLVESSGLLAAATTFPEFGRAAAWRSVALDRFAAQMHEQIYADGGHAELAFGYHLLCLEHFIFPLQLDGSALLAREPDYLKRLNAMIDFLLLTRKPDGRVPLINDTNDEQTGPLLKRLLDFARREDVRFAATDGAEGRPPHQTSAALPLSGYYVMRSDWTPKARYLIFDAGGYGGFHGHEDKLGFELSAYGTDMLVDGGGYAYSGDAAFRGYFISSRAHNVLLIDGLGQNRYRLARYKLAAPADAAAALPQARWESAGTHDYAAATYDEGFSPMHPAGRGAKTTDTSFTHTRGVLFVKPDYWVVQDVVGGSGEHEVTQLWHLRPDTQVEIKEGAVCAQFPNGASLQLLAEGAPEISVVSGATEPIQGWVATAYAEKTEAPVVMVTRRVTLPATLITVLAPSAGTPKPLRFSLARDGQTATAELRWPRQTDRLVFTEGPPQPGSPAIAFHRIDARGNIQREFSVEQP